MQPAWSSYSCAARHHRDQRLNVKDDTTTTSTPAASLGPHSVSLIRVVAIIITALPAASLEQLRIIQSKFSLVFTSNLPITTPPPPTHPSFAVDIPLEDRCCPSLQRPLLYRRKHIDSENVEAQPCPHSHAHCSRWHSLLQSLPPLPAASKSEQAAATTTQSAVRKARPQPTPQRWVPTYHPSTPIWSIQFKVSRNRSATKLRRCCSLALHPTCAVSLEFPIITDIRC